MMRCGHQASRGPRSTRAAVLCAFVVFCAGHAPAQAQRVGSAVNPSASKEASAAPGTLRLDYSQTPVAVKIALPDADSAIKQSMTQSSGDLPLQIGVHRAISDEFQGDLSPKLDWEQMGDGSIVSSVSVTSPGASAMRMSIEVELPEGGELRFFDGQSNTGSDGSGYPVIGPIDLVPKNGAPESFAPSAAEPEVAGAGSALSGLSFSLEEAAADVLWSPAVKGDTIGVEISLPSVDALSGFSFSIGKVSHIDGPIEATTFDPLRLNCTNHIDVQCAQGRFPATQADAVASILFDDDEGTFVCSGTLLNDTLDDTFIPYFLTAHHCVSRAEVANTVEAWWFFRRAACGLVEIDERFTVTYGGADVLATTLAQDSTLLRLKSQVPAEVSYAGWSADPVLHPAVVHGLHHPRGDEMKYSAGRTLGQGDIQVGNLGTVLNAIVVRWRDGATEGGSSGSGLFDGEHLIGALSAGNRECEGGTDVYGSLRDFFPQVRRWLDPVWSLDLPFVTAASNQDQQGFVRIANHSGRAGTVRIHAVDDTGEYRGPIELSMDAHQAAHFNSQDLESGNPSKGLSGGFGDGAGNWRLELTARFPIDARAYIRTADGFLASIHEVAAEVAPEVETTQDMAVRYHVPIFNPGDNDLRQSRLRLINTGVEAAEIVISGQDDNGESPPRGKVYLTLAGGAAHMLTAQEIEEGGDGIRGGFGDGAGRWRLTVSADQPLQVMSLMQSATGHLTNLSR